MRALTLWQPWATCIAHHGKDVENRTWPPPDRMIGIRLAIHAGKGFDRASAKDLIARGLLPPNEARRLPFGAVVCVARLVGVMAPGVGRGPWRQKDQLGWKLGEVQALPEPIPCRGYQGLWTLPPEVEVDVRVALGEGRP